MVLQPLPGVVPESEGEPFRFRKLQTIVRPRLLVRRGTVAARQIHGQRQNNGNGFSIARDRRKPFPPI